ncbi:MAG: hypothetical protein JW867_00425, partial [Candidatus Omnitrophica bacterium]|nr:hypothetical protein [Candidatus Omnitrophota bacterium]
MSYLSVIGDWRMTIFGNDIQGVGDPASHYLANGINFFDYAHVPYSLHPGLNLTFLIQIIAKIYYWLSTNFGMPVSYGAFVGKNLVTLFFLSRVMVSAVYLVSFYLLFLFSSIFLKSRAHALIAVFAYATTLNVIFYHNVVNVESIMLSFVILTFLCFWQYINRVKGGKAINGLKYIILSSLFAVLAFYSKFLLCWPLLILIPFYILVYKRTQTGTIPFKSRLLGSGVFLLFSGALLYIVGKKIDFSRFLQVHFYLHNSFAARHYGLSGIIYNKQHSWLFNAGSNLAQFLREYIGIIFWRLPTFMYNTKNLTWAHSNAAFKITEYPFLIMFLFGVFLYWKKNPQMRLYLIHLLLFIILITPALLYRAGFHYFFFHLAFGAVFFSYFIRCLYEKIVPGCANDRRQFFILAIGTLLIHSASVAGGLGAKINDLRQYKKWRPYHMALKDIGYNERIGIIRDREKYKEDSQFLNSLSGGFYSLISRKSEVSKNFTEHFVFSDEDFSQEALRKDSIKVVMK